MIMINATWTLAYWTLIYSSFLVDENDMEMEQ